MVGDGVPEVRVGVDAFESHWSAGSSGCGGAICILREGAPCCRRGHATLTRKRSRTPTNFDPDQIKRARPSRFYRHGTPRSDQANGHHRNAAATSACHSIQSGAERNETHPNSVDDIGLAVQHGIGRRCDCGQWSEHGRPLARSRQGLYPATTKVGGSPSSASTRRSTVRRATRGRRAARHATARAPITAPTLRKSPAWCSRARARMRRRRRATLA